MTTAPLSSFAAQTLRSCPLFLMLLMAACSSNNVVTGSDGDPTTSGTQSETAATTALVGNTTRIVVAYNDETNEQNLITYTDSTRVVNSGASLMGWSYSDNGGASWTYGGKLKPPSGWSVLWGDPAIGTSKAKQDVVFMSNLAVPNGKFPAGGIQGGLQIGLHDAYIGGACLAKSTNGGKTFDIYQCVANTDPVPNITDSTQGHFYDGGSIAGASTGEIFAAWVDVSTQQIDVYRSPDENGTFTRIAPPFPGMYMGSHPRLRTAPDGSLYVAAQGIAYYYNNTPFYRVYMNRYANGSWGTPLSVSQNSVFYVDINFGTSVQGSPLTLRTGNQISFDIGASSEGGNDAIRLLYQRQDDQTKQLFIDAAVCPADLSACYMLIAPGWSTLGDAGPGKSLIDFYNPEVVAWPGSAGSPATWQATWAFHYGTTQTVNVSRTTLGYVNGTPLIFPVDIIKNAPVCTDTRGYWGDYDAMLLTGIQGTKSIWMRFLTDSSKGCSKRWQYTAESQHVQQANYAY